MAAALISATAVVSLIGYWGWFFVPPIVLLTASGERRDLPGSAG